MLPSSCLKVILEEVETPPLPTSSLDEFKNSPLRQQLSIPVDNRYNHGKEAIKNELLNGFHYPKKLPQALLAECTVEPCNGVSRKSQLKPRFEVVLVPVCKSDIENNGKIELPVSDSDEVSCPKETEGNINKSDSVEVDALPEVEAVYSDHNSLSDEEIIFENISSVDKNEKSDDRENHVEIHMCKFCHKIFPNKGVLFAHTNVAHFDQINCKCPICGRVFNRNSNLLIHIRSHETEGVPIPDKYKSVKPLSINSMSDVSPDRPFKCPYCPKFYSQRSVLKKHMVVHTGERLTCNLCGIDFTQKSSLLRHTKRIHSEKTPFFTKTTRKVPPLLNLHLSDHLNKMLSSKNSSSLEKSDDDLIKQSVLPQLLSMSHKLSSTLLSSTNLPHPTDNAEDKVNNSKHSITSEETDHSIDMPQKMANFIQSLNIPQGISISMIDD